MMFIKSAFAEDIGVASGTGAAGTISSLMPLLLIMVVFYFFVIRPQQRKIKLHNEMIGAIKDGDTVVTGGGIYGKVKTTEKDTLFIEIANDTIVQIARESIAKKVSQ